MLSKLRWRKSKRKWRKSGRMQHFSERINRLYFSIVLIFTTVASGIFGFMLIEAYNFLEAFYMTIITLSTVGYTEVRPLTDNGRIFAAILIISNIGIFTYAISVLSSFVIEGDIKQIWKYYNMIKKIEQLSNHVIICGFGRYGAEVAQNLNKQDVNVVIIELEQDIVSHIYKETKFLCIEGDATHDDVLEEAGIRSAKALISTLADDSDNVFVALTARQINPDLRIVSRAINPKSESKLKLAGANEVIMPERIGGFYMANLVGKPDLVEFFTTVSAEIEDGVYLEEIDFDNLSESYTNKTIKELNIRKETGTNVIALKKANGEYIINPSPNVMIESQMHLIVLGSRKQIKRFKEFWGK
ncbi:MAG: potassium channel family protein [Chitinophagales bacterium]